jgi:hypothetical protein
MMRWVYAKALNSWLASNNRVHDVSIHLTSTSDVCFLCQKCSDRPVSGCGAMLRFYNAKDSYNVNCIRRSAILP